MSSSIIPCVPYEQIITKNIAGFSVTVRNVILNTSADVITQLYDADGHLMDVLFYTLTSDEYANWGITDNYIITLMCTKYGITLA